MGYNNVKDILINKSYDNNNQYIVTTIIYNNATAEKGCMRQLRKGKEDVSGFYVQFLFSIYFCYFFSFANIYLPSMKSFFLSLSLLFFVAATSSLFRHCCLRIHSMRIYSYTSIGLKFVKNLSKSWGGGGKET